MGGEFFLRSAPNIVIDQTKWAKVLALITADMKMNDVPGRDSQVYAFEYVDPKAAFNTTWDSKGQVVPTKDSFNKYFRLRWEWSDEAVENQLGGRKRSDWSSVRRVCERLCDNFPGLFALVVCDGFSGVEDDEDNIYYDGFGRKYKKLDYNYWPWKDNICPKDAIVEHQYFALDRVKVILPDERQGKASNSSGGASSEEAKVEDKQSEATVQTAELKNAHEGHDLLQQYRFQFSAMETIIYEQRQLIKQQQEVIAVLLSMQQEQQSKKRKV